MKIAMIMTSIFALIICFTLVFDEIFESDTDNYSHKIFRYILNTNIVCLVLDIITWILHDTTYNTIAYVLNLFIFIFGYFLIAFFSFYITAYIKEDNSKEFKLSKIFSLVIFVFIIINVILILTGHVYKIENGYYYSLDLAFIPRIFAAIGMLFNIVFAIICRKKLSIRDFAAVLSYELFPVASIVLTMFIEGVTFTYLSVTLSLLFIYLTLESKRYQKIIVDKNDLYVKVNVDFLTGLLNRRAYDNYINTLTGERTINVIFIDVNGLKYNNDHFGHKAGDQLLIDMKNILVKYFSQDNIFRISGDEFVIICDDSEKTFKSNYKKLLKDINNYEYPIASVGYSTGIAKKFDKLIEEAENNMYSEKEEFHKKYSKYKRN